MAEEDLPEVKFAEYPQRSCRLVETTDGFTDHACMLPEEHPGPHCPNTREGIRRRQLWERGHPGWQAMARDPDPFRDITKAIGLEDG